MDPVILMMLSLPSKEWFQGFALAYANFRKGTSTHLNGRTLQRGNPTIQAFTRIQFNCKFFLLHFLLAQTLILSETELLFYLQFVHFVLYDRTVWFI